MTIDTSKIKKINLKPYTKGNNGFKALLSEKEGRRVRFEHNMNKVDENDSVVMFLVPKEVYNITVEFYNGLLYDSYKTLGHDKFLDKYKWKIMGSSSSPGKMEDITKQLVECFSACIEKKKENS